MRIQVTLIQKGTLEKIEGTGNWKVVNPYIWEVRNGVVREIVIPNGFITDFGSIPRLLWIVFNPTEYHSYILHDYLYSFNILPRDTSDLSLQLGLLSEGAPQYESIIVWIGVRVFGFLYYKKQYDNKLK